MKNEKLDARIENCPYLLLLVGALSNSLINSFAFSPSKAFYTPFLVNGKFHQMENHFRIRHFCRLKLPLPKLEPIFIESGFGTLTGIKAGWNLITSELNL